MTKFNSTKKSLFASVIALMLCFSMLLGTTFAWFTDTVTSENNIIKSGTLKVGMYWAEGTEDPASVTWTDASTGAIFNNDKWEPGYAEVRHIKIANEGTLALKYQLAIAANGEVSKLADVIDVYFIDGAEQIAKREDLPEDKKVGTLTQVLAGMPANASGDLFETEIDTVTIALKMQETAGNEYQDLAIGSSFAIKLVATQLEAELDSFGDDYDASAKYPAVETQTVPAGTSAKINAEGVSTVIPATAGAGEYRLEVSNYDVKTEGTETTVSYDISLYKDNAKVSGQPIEVGINIGKGLDVTSVTHNGTAIADYDYNAVTGVVTFVTDSFSPFAVTYTKKVVKDGVVDGDSLIKAIEEKSVIEFAGDVKIDPASMSNAYGATGISITKGQTIEGNGFTLDIKGAGGTWDSGINTTGGTIRNLKVTGSFRGIFINHNSSYSAPVILEKVVIEGTTYTISCDQGTNKGLTATGSTFKGWTSFAETLGDAKFVNCTFGAGNGYNYSRPYAPTTYENCKFEKGHKVDPRAAVTFKNCTIDGVVLTAKNIDTLVTNTANVTVK